ncbi:TetR-like C-terminal domain-containing protein [Tardiphaga robiniae]|jgi:hypothetical protein|uniref:TetR-like C-terminal domain-containing protein n=1 Tax=Tardiphaga TaxID=1395974 RepID=UPI002859C43A|nr:TetR-like C-terminal domain-containing protein [Tardiphaga robiniae]MDR6663271.1 hypothetical protein [Tardiphaga robiniae]
MGPLKGRQLERRFVFSQVRRAAAFSAVDVEQVLRPLESRWDKHIAADLISEMEPYLGKVSSLPELRTALAIKGYRGLQSRIESSVSQLSGTAALRAMAHAMRGFALANPGLAAASFRSLDVTSPEWEVSGHALARTVVEVFASCGIHDDKAISGALIMRSLVRGFVVNEMSSSNHSLDFQRSFSVAIEMFIAGLGELRLDKTSAEEAIG